MTPADRLTALETWKEGFAQACKEERVRQQQTNADLEQRMRRVERALYMCTGVLAVLQVILKLSH